MARMKLLDTPNISKELAFTPRKREKSIPIDHAGFDFEFTKRWFVRRNQKTFSTFLPGRFANKPTRMIQIGVFEGMDLIWSLQNILTNSSSLVVAIDPWDATRKLSQEKMNAVEDRARANLRPWRKKVTLIKGYSSDIMDHMINGEHLSNCSQHIPPGRWDLIIVDGDHNADAVYNDAMRALQLVRVGGWIVFDDVRNRTRKKDHVAHGLRGWLLESDLHVKLAWYHRYMNCYERIK